MVEYLLERGADVEATDDVSNVIVWYETAHTEDISVIYLVHSTCAQDGQGALQFVSSRDVDHAMEIVAMFVKYGANLFAVSKV